MSATWGADVPSVIGTIEAHPCPPGRSDGVDRIPTVVKLLGSGEVPF